MEKTFEYRDNLVIKFAVEDLIGSSELEPLFKLVDSLILRAQDGGKVPVVFEGYTHIAWNLDPDTDINEVFPEDLGYEMRYATMVDEEGNRWIPFFTDTDEIKELVPTDTVSSVSIATIIEEAFEDKDIAGILINPFSAGFALRNKMLQHILIEL